MFILILFINQLLAAPSTITSITTRATFRNNMNGKGGSCGYENNGWMTGGNDFTVKKVDLLGRTFYGVGGQDILRIGNAACGQCYEVTGPKGVAYAVVADYCPGGTCTIDMAPTLFKAVGGITASGGVTVTAKPIPCSFKGGVEWSFADGGVTNDMQWYINLHNLKGPVQSAVLKTNFVINFWDQKPDFANVTGKHEYQYWLFSFNGYIAKKHIGGTATISITYYDRSTDSVVVKYSGPVTPPRQFPYY